jgi:spore germination cell wall hydrolase CwlJ-like protein
MFGSFRARIFALAFSMAVGLSAAPAAAAAAESSPNLDLGALISPSAPSSILAPATPVAVQNGTESSRPLHDMIISFVDYRNQSAEQLCLAKAVYFEARGETEEGQLAVAQVVLNRAASGVYPPTICGVVTQHAQFSFVHDGNMPDPDTSSGCWRKALAIADVAMKHLAPTVATNVLWYHATYVAPAWGRQHVRVAQIGTHIFYS